MSRSMLSGQASHEAQRWIPPDVGIPPPVVEEAEPPPPPTAEELEAIREDARASGTEAGYRAGYEAGEREAREQVLQQAEEERHAREAREAAWLAQQEATLREQEATLRETVAAFEAMAQALADPLAATVDALEPELLTLTTTLARRVIMEELSLRPELIQGVLRQALAQLPSRHHPVRVHMHPDEQTMLAAYAEASGENLTWVADPAIERGGCLIDSGPSRIDASLDARLRQAIDAIWGELAPPAEPAPAARQETAPDETLADGISANDVSDTTEAMSETMLDALTDVMPDAGSAANADSLPEEADEPPLAELESEPEPLEEDR